MNVEDITAALDLVFERSNLTVVLPCGDIVRNAEDAATVRRRLDDLDIAAHYVRDRTASWNGFAWRTDI